MSKKKGTKAQYGWSGRAFSRIFVLKVFSLHYRENPMKATLYAVLLLIATGALAGPAKKYGKELTVKETTKISSILADPGKFDGKMVRVEGAVVGVCEKRGCWIRLASDREFESIQLKVEDGVIVFPMDAKGKNAVAEGVVDVRTVSVEDQIAQGKHHEEETGEKFDPSTVKGPKTIVRIMGEGAEIR
jgi:hypothetical protein